MYKTVIVDDEQSGREVLQLLLQKHCPNIAIVATAGTVSEAVEVIQQHQPELVFLDIELEKDSGFDILNNPLIREQVFSIIFTTAHEQYAIKAIKEGAIDYLLKPIDVEELKTAVSKAVNKEFDEVITIMNQVRKTIKVNPKLKLVNREGFELVDLETIIYCKSEGNYTRFFFKDGSSSLTSKTLKKYQVYLESYGFMRIHKSHIVNLNEIKRFIHGKVSQVVLSDGQALDVSKDIKPLLMDRFQ
jgi:two-component system LytT family response regulator